MNVLGSVWVKRGAIALAILLVAGFAVGALVKNRPEAAGSYGAPVVGGTRAVQKGAIGYDASGASVGEANVSGAGVTPPDGDSFGAPGSTLPPIGDRIVKNGDLSVQVRRGSFDSAWNRAFGVATRFGGYVLSSSRGRQDPAAEEKADDSPQFGDITIRVPAGKYETALVELRRLGKVTGDVSSSEDVTQEFVDLEGRLRNARAQEAVLLKLMARATSIEDTIAVQGQLSQVQLQIEEITGRLRYLRSQTDLSTITLHVAEPGAAAAPGEGPSLSQAWETAIEGLQRIGAAVMIGGLWLAPFALLAAVVLGWRRRGARPAPQA